MSSGVRVWMVVEKNQLLVSTVNISIPFVGLSSHGGIRILVQFANIAAKAGHKVSFYYPRGKSSHVYRIDERVELVEVGPRIRNKFVGWVVFGCIFPFVNKGDLIVANHFVTYYPSVFARRKKKVVYLVQDIEFRFYPWLLSKIAYLICRGSYRSDQMFAANKYLYEELKAFGSPRGCLDYGIDPIFIKQPLTSVPAAEKSFDVIYFLRREFHKRRGRFEKILPGLLEKGYKVVCVSQDQSLLDEFAQRFEVEVRKPANDLDLVACMDSARVMVLTSDHEGFALPPLECMARKIPVIVYDCGGPRDYAVHGENALVLENDDSAPLLETIELLLEDGALYARLAENARKTAERYDVELDLARFLEEVTADIDI